MGPREELPPVMRVAVSVSATDGSGMIRVEGEVDAETSKELRVAATELVDVGVQAVVLDCSDVTFMDSSGLSVLIEVHERMLARGGTLTVRHPGEMLARLMVLTGLDEELRVEALD